MNKTFSWKINSLRAKKKKKRFRRNTGNIRWEKKDMIYFFFTKKKNLLRLSHRRAYELAPECHSKHWIPLVVAVVLQGRCPLHDGDRHHVVLKISRKRVASMRPTPFLPRHFSKVFFPPFFLLFSINSFCSERGNFFILQERQNDAIQRS